MDTILDWAFGLSLPQAVFWLIVANFATFALAVWFGSLLVAAFPNRRIAPPPAPLTRREILYTLAGIIVNILVTIAGWLCWKQGWLIIRRDTGWRAWLDIPIFILVMDLGMYLLHRVVHSSWLYPIHRLHHEYENPRPLTLFVMNPLETLGFGLLWLAVILLCHFSWLGLLVYAVFNLAAGTLAHLGIETFPTSWPGLPVLRQIGTSTSHAEHHQDPHHNYGFYTLLWDRLFGTLHPDYTASFGRSITQKETIPNPPNV